MGCWATLYPERSEGPLVPRAKDGRCFGVPQHDKYHTSLSSPRLGVSAFIPAFDLPLSFLALPLGVLGVLAFIPPSIHANAHRQQQVREALLVGGLDGQDVVGRLHRL